MLRVDATQLDLAREFRARPFGPHGAELQRLLKLLRWEPIAGRLAIVKPDPTGPYYLARSTGPKGHRMELYASSTYDTMDTAFWALFRARWEQHTGSALVLDASDGESPIATDAELGWHARPRPILGYANRFSVAAGQCIEFKVSADLEGDKPRSDGSAVVTTPLSG